MTEIGKRKTENELRRLKLQGTLQAIESTLNFVAVKSAGGTLLASGLLEFLSPDLISAILPQPLGVAGIGLALLAGKQGARILLKAAEGLLR